MESLIKISLVCLMVELLVMRMVLMMEIGLIQLTEKHLEKMTEMNLAHPREKPKERRLGCLSAESMMEMQMVYQMESG